MTRAPRSTQRAAQQADHAADQLLDWLRQQRGGIFDESLDAAQHDVLLVVDQTIVGELAPASAESVLGDERSSSRYRNRGVGSALRLSQPDWLHHRLNVTGPAAALTGFQMAAGGAGTIPWPLDRDRMEEELFHLLVAPPAPQRRRLSLGGARVLARQLGEAAEMRHAAAVARVGHSRACPFDLNALVPVPPDILPLGPDHPDSLAWLQAHWGTTEPLRHVVLEPALPQRQRPPPGTASLRLSFWSADWTPWQALDTVAARWPALRFAVVPTYEPL